MKLPVYPTKREGFYDLMTNKSVDWFVETDFWSGSPVDAKGRYLHWDKLRHLPTPESLTSEEWWHKIKHARRSMYKQVPFVAINGSSFNYATVDEITRELHWLDRYASGSIQASDVITKPQTRDTYLIRSLIEEAINSSQLEGASTTSDVAKEMIRQDRSPSDESEHMILNNYLAMQFIREIKNEVLTPSIIFELHTILTRNTLTDDKTGCFRTEEDDIHVVDNRTKETLHTPPKADQLHDRLERLCDFANQSGGQDGNFLHPVVKAIVLHFMLGYDHPFYDGNGRTARALFYWAMSREGYWLTEFVSISRVLKLAPAQYAQAYMYTETDENDLTYFLIHQLDVIHKAVDSLHEYLARKVEELNQAENLLIHNPRLRGRLNPRQLSLLKHALKHPRFSYIVREHQRSHGISYDVARKDLSEMSDQLNLLIKTKKGRSYYFVVPNDLEQRIAKK